MVNKLSVMQMEPHNKLPLMHHDMYRGGHSVWWTAWPSSSADRHKYCQSKRPLLSNKVDNMQWSMCHGEIFQVQSLGQIIKAGAVGTMSMVSTVRGLMLELIEFVWLQFSWGLRFVLQDVCKISHSPQSGRGITVLNYCYGWAFTVTLLTLCGLTSQKTHQGGLGLGGSVHEEAHPCFPYLI